MSKHYVLIDGHHMMYRAYWAIPRTMKTNAGEQVNTVFGMASMLLAILQKEEPDAVVVCFDEGNQTFRHQENETYKDGRAETPDDFYSQIPRTLELITAFGFPQVSDPQYEADDFLASYALAAKKEGHKVTIVSGDRDLFQIVGDGIRVAVPHKGYQAAEYFSPEGVEAKLGVRPDQIASYKGLCGDSSDNLPGVHGIGPKTAATLLQQYNSLEGIYAALDDIKGSAREKLERDKEQAFFCERMAQLALDIELPVSLEDSQIAFLHSQDILAFFKELNFTLLAKRFTGMLQTPYGKTHFTELDAKDTEHLATPEPKKTSQLSMF